MTEQVYHALRVASITEETKDAKSFVFDVPPELKTLYQYKPGQFLTLRLPVVSGKVLPRSYSMSSAPSLDAKPRVTVKRVSGGRGSNWLCDQIKVGDELDVMPPAGVFTLKSADCDLLLLAGGSGITPIFSILRSALANGHGRILLLYANRDERSVIFKDLLNKLAADYAERFTVIHWLDSVQGTPSLAQLTALAQGWQSAQAFICGPAPFMEMAVEALGAAGLGDDQVFIERFVSLPDEDEIELIKAAASSEVQGVDQADVEIDLDGELFRVTVPSGQTVLEAALAAGVQVPHSCQVGMCASCMCQVTEGEVHLRHNEVLDDKDLEKNWTLSCQAVPTSQRLRLKFPD